MAGFVHHQISLGALDKLDLVRYPARAFLRPRYAMPTGSNEETKGRPHRVKNWRLRTRVAAWRAGIIAFSKEYLDR